MTNKEILKTWFAALDSKDFNKIKSLMDSKYQFQNPMSPTPMGAEEHLGMMQMMVAGFDATHKLDVIIEEGDYVAASGSWSGKHTGTFNGIPATGKPVELKFVGFFKIENGKVVSQHVEFNPMAFMMLASESASV